MNLHVDENKPIKLKVGSSLVNASLGSSVVVKEVQAIPYTGEYIVTPSSEAQTLLTADLLMAENVTINPIPSNYGLITWNGSFLTVS